MPSKRVRKIPDIKTSSDKENKQDTSEEGIKVSDETLELKEEASEVKE